MERISTIKRFDNTDRGKMSHEKRMHLGTGTCLFHKYNRGAFYISNCLMQKKSEQKLIETSRKSGRILQKIILQCHYANNSP